MSSGKVEEEYDIFKHSALRYLGYSNEIGEAFRPIVPRYIVNWSYLVEIIYFFSDTFHKGHKAYVNPKDEDTRVFGVIKASSYTLVWQFFASVALPAFMINRVIKGLGYVLNKSSMSGGVKYIPTMIGLCLIPVLPIVLDPLVDKVMINTLGNRI